MKTDYKLCKSYEKEKADDSTLKSCKDMIDAAFLEANDKCQRLIPTDSFMMRNT